MLQIPVICCRFSCGCGGWDVHVVVRQLSYEVCASIVHFLSGPHQHDKKKKRVECVCKNECLYVCTPGDHSFSNKLVLLDPCPVHHFVFFWPRSVSASLHNLENRCTGGTELLVWGGANTLQTVTRKRKKMIPASLGVITAEVRLSAALTCIASVWP